MAPKRPSPLEKPPVASSSEEEEVESSEEEEEEQKQQQKKASSPSIPRPAPVVSKKPSKKPATQPHSSSDNVPRPAPAVNKKPSKKPATQPHSSSDKEGSESDSDHPPPRGVAADPNVKPISSKPMVVDGSKLKKPRSKSASTPTKSRAKRPVENSSGEGKDSKPAKKMKKGAEADMTDMTEKKAAAVVEATGEGSKTPFQRLWSEEDEIAILEGMIEYSEKKGTHPATDLDGFYLFMKKLLDLDFTRMQLLNKIRRLKKKFVNKAGKGKMTFSKPNDQKSYDLSKKIWGKEKENEADANPNNGGEGEVGRSKSNSKAKKSGNSLTLAEKQQLLASLRAPAPAPAHPKDAPPPTPNKEAEEPNKEQNVGRFSMGIVGIGGLDESFVKDGLALVDSTRRSELENEWRKLHLAETEVFMMRMQLVREQTKLVLDAIKNQH